MKKLFIFLGLCIFCSMVLLGGRYVYIKTKYPGILDKIESRRIEYSELYKSANSKERKNEIIDQARNYLNEILPTEIFPAWYGTLWSFNGNAEYPLQGSIACGSFVENALRNIGFEIDTQMSAQPSEYIIKNMCDEKDILRFSNVPIKSFNGDVQNMGDGVFIVGLDKHVGFLYVLDGKYRFVHSHGYLFVLSEIPSLSPILRMSKYRVIGKLFSNKMIEQWLYGEKITLRYNYFEKNH